MPPFPQRFEDETNDQASSHERPSKSQRKRDMTALQKLGEELVAQPRDRLTRVHLPDQLRDAVQEAQRITSHEGRRRQMQYIGKLMRDVDTAPIQAALDAWNGESSAETAQLHTLERWRTRLLADDKALDQLVAAHTAALNPLILQQLRAHIRAARREQTENRPPRHFRELYQLLKTITTDPGTQQQSADD